MILKDFSVIHAQPNSDVVVLYCWHDKQTVLASIPTVHLEVYFRRERLTGKEANLVVDRNLDSFARIISARNMSAASTGPIRGLVRPCRALISRWKISRRVARF